MNTEPHVITVSGVRVQVVRKAIKNLHLGVYPPEGRVRVAAPMAVSDDAVRLAVVGKLGWIKRQRTRFKAQLRQSEREMVSGESHYFLGQRYSLSHEKGGTHLEMRFPAVSCRSPFVLLGSPVHSRRERALCQRLAKNEGREAYISAQLHPNCKDADRYAR